MPLKLMILGSGSSIPTIERNSTSQLLFLNNKSFLIDCGEGTQHQLIKYNCKLNRIEKFFISHLHGDHFFGLAGLLSSLRLLGREKNLQIYGPEDLQKSIECVFRLSEIEFGFNLEFIKLEKNNGKSLIFEDDEVLIYSFPLLHRIETFGFLFVEKEKDLNIKKDFVKNHQISIEKYKEIKSGKDFIDKNGKLHKNEEICYQPHKPQSYAYCSDTAYYEDMQYFFKNVDLLYHESSFLNNEINLASEKQHSTAEQAAMIAKITKSKNLLLGHFSNRYKTVDEFQKQASQIFKNVMLAYDGLEIDFETIS